VARHSGTQKAVVRLSFGADRLEMDVEDHGRGIDAATTRRGLGLVAMRERAALVGGTLDFLRPPQGGTLVRLSMPL
jgi:signal transduction histidine kinase